MENINIFASDYGDIIELFTEDKIKSRITALTEQINAFIDVYYKDSVSLNPYVLATAVMNYFVDVSRLKEFHETKKINQYKVYGYMSYWLLKGKPIQITNSATPALRFVNEHFVLCYINAFLLETANLKDDGENAALVAFEKSLFYYMKYRFISAQTLELMLLGFGAGLSINSTNKDPINIEP